MTIRTCNEDEFRTAPSYGWDGEALTVTFPTPKDVRRKIEEDRAWAQHQGDGATWGQHESDGATWGRTDGATWGHLAPVTTIHPGQPATGKYTAGQRDRKAA